MKSSIPIESEEFSGGSPNTLRFLKKPELGTEISLDNSPAIKGLLRKASENDNEIHFDRKSTYRKTSLDIQETIVKELEKEKGEHHE